MIMQPLGFQKVQTAAAYQHLNPPSLKFSRSAEMPILPGDTRQMLYEWNHDAVLTRLAHLREKAPHVRELVVYNEPEINMELFLEDIVPDLTRTHGGDMCEYHGGAVQGQQEMDIGRLALPQPPGQLTRLESITSYEGCLYDEARPFLEIPLNHFGYMTETPMIQISLFEPSGAHFRRLTSLKLGVEYRNWRCRSFNFSDIPQASISVKLHLFVEFNYDLGELKDALPTLFVEDLRGFNVACDYNMGTTVVDWRPSRQYKCETNWASLRGPHGECHTSTSGTSGDESVF
ncbi:hypothetical protein BJ138DRAFT_1129072 [Hygrophoropsis aurantiaca]|uniref:Uncharacterized protein n=1 Tax=Hygrophoropsis aurantiaca TaxID=72124 RepID=A0ACB8A4L9_9AGAM|nr:hypothetical protein BJ138DRAFT_1129072 [Hygrophoropsis aurantiaca]